MTARDAICVTAKAQGWNLASGDSLSDSLSFTRGSIEVYVMFTASENVHSARLWQLEVDGSKLSRGDHYIEAASKGKRAIVLDWLADEFVGSTTLVLNASSDRVESAEEALNNGAYSIPTFSDDARAEGSQAQQRERTNLHNHTVLISHGCAQCVKEARTESAEEAFNRGAYEAAEVAMTARDFSALTDQALASEVARLSDRLQRETGSIDLSITSPFNQVRQNLARAMGATEIRRNRAIASYVESVNETMSEDTYIYSEGVAAGERDGVMSEDLVYDPELAGTWPSGGIEAFKIGHRVGFLRYVARVAEGIDPDAGFNFRCGYSAGHTIKPCTIRVATDSEYCVDHEIVRAAERKVEDDLEEALESSTAEEALESIAYERNSLLDGFLISDADRDSSAEYIAEVAERNGARILEVLSATGEYDRSNLVHEYIARNTFALDQSQAMGVAAYRRVIRRADTVAASESFRKFAAERELFLESGLAEGVGYLGA